MAEKLYSLSEIIRNIVFGISCYQQRYVWSGEQLAEFWDDLINLQVNKYPYMGSLALKPLSDKGIKTLSREAWLIIIYLHENRFFFAK